MLSAQIFLGHGTVEKQFYTVVSIIVFIYSTKLDPTHTVRFVYHKNWKKLDIMPNVITHVFDINAECSYIHVYPILSIVFLDSIIKVYRIPVQLIVCNDTKSNEPDVLHMNNGKQQTIKPNHIYKNHPAPILRHKSMQIKASTKKQT